VSQLEIQLQLADFCHVINYNCRSSGDQLPNSLQLDFQLPISAASSVQNATNMEGTSQTAETVASENIKIVLASGIKTRVDVHNLYFIMLDGSRNNKK